MYIVNDMTSGKDLYLLYLFAILQVLNDADVSTR